MRYLNYTTVTDHAWKKITAKAIPKKAIKSVLDYGRAVHTRGVVIYAIGRKEVDFYQNKGIDLADFEGVHVVVSHSNSILTVYKNKKLKSLRKFRQRRGHKYPKNQKAFVKY